MANRWALTGTGSVRSVYSESEGAGCSQADMAVLVMVAECDLWMREESAVFAVGVSGGGWETGGAGAGEARRVEAETRLRIL